jgi:hypothetical protein
MDDFRGHDKKVAHGDNRGVENYVRSGEFGSVLFGQWLPRTFAASTADEMRRITLSAREGDICFYTADAANGVDWQFRFRPDGSAYPWKYVGGSEQFSYVATDEGTAITHSTYQALATPGPIIVSPFAGTYMVSIGCDAYNNNAPILVAPTMSYDVSSQSGTTAASDTWGALTVSAPSFHRVSNIFPYKHESSGGPVTFTAKYRDSQNQGVRFTKRWMSVVPVRVAG